MNIKKIFKIVSIGYGLHILMNVCYHSGKGRMLRYMKQDNLTVDDVQSNIEYVIKNGSLKDRLIFTIIDASANP